MIQAPEGVSWANIVEKNSAEKRGTYKRRGPVKMTPPRSGNVKKNYTGRNLIYTRKPIRELNGTVVRGTWVPAINVEGDYGGPYNDLMDLLRNPRYQADMKEFKELQEEGAMKARRRGRSRSRSRSRSTRRRSRSRSTRRRSRSRSRSTRRRSRSRRSHSRSRR